MSKESKQSDENNDDLVVDVSAVKKKLGSLFSGSDNKKNKNNENNNKENKKSSKENTTKAAKEKSTPHSTDSKKESENIEVVDIESQEVEKENEIISNDDEEETPKSSEDSISFNTDQLKTFGKKYWHYMCLILIIIFVIYMRSQVVYAPITDQWAENSMRSYIASQAQQQVNQLHPNLPQTNKAELINNEIENVYATQKDSIAAQTAQLSAQYKEAISYEYNGKRYVYLGDIDSYFWLRFARNVVNNGHICDEIRDGKCWDNHIFAPVGGEVTTTMHPEFIALVYKFTRAIGLDYPIMHIGMIVPTIVAIFAAIAAFFVGYFLVGKLAGLIASLLISSNSMYVQRSLGSDNDIYTLLIPLIILAFLFLALKTPNLKKKIGFALVSGFFVGTFPFSWEGGWWNIFLAIVYAYIGYLIFLIIYEFVRNKKLGSAFTSKLFKENIISFASFYLGGIIGFLLIMPIKGFSFMFYLRAPLLPFDFVRFQKAAVNLNVWPNVITTVAEFNAISLASVPRQLFLNYGNLLFFFAIFGLTLLFAHQLFTKKNQWILLPVSFFSAVLLSTTFILTKVSYIMYFILIGIFTFGYFVYVLVRKLELTPSQHYHLLIGSILTVWFIGTLYASTEGVRFVLLMVPPISIAIGCCFQIAYEKILEILSDLDVGKMKYVVQIILIVTLFALPVTVARDSVVVSQNFTPHFNAAWDAALTDIRENSEPDAIINSWWDFGHWFKHVADRAVTLDGATQNSPQLHWLGKLLLTSDEKESRGILRMLDCGANQAFDVIVNTTEDIPFSVDIINEIIMLDDKDEVRSVLASYDIPEADQERVLERTHCDPPENYLIASDDMIGKSGVWSHFGSWDFYKAEIASLKLAGLSRNEIVTELTENRRYRTTNASDVEFLYNQLASLRNDGEINAWIAPWPSYFSNANCNKETNSSLHVCDNGLQFDEATEECFLTNPSGTVYPETCLYVDGVDVKIKKYNESLLIAEGRIIGTAFIPRGDGQLQLVMGDSSIVGSMFTRMFHMQGHGLTYFDQFSYHQSPLGARIFTYKSDWNGGDVHDAYGFTVVAENNETAEN